MELLEWVSQETKTVMPEDTFLQTEVYEALRKSGLEPQLNFTENSEPTVLWRKKTTVAKWLPTSFDPSTDPFPSPLYTLVEVSTFEPNLSRPYMSKEGFITLEDSTN